MSNAGICALCLQITELLVSHYIPRSAYKPNREDGLANPNPVVIASGRAFQSQSQAKDRLLCSKCEDRFNTHGERWTLRHTPRRYGSEFPLQKALSKHKPVVLQENELVYPGVSIPEFDMEKLVYFGMSVFWRGAVHKWPVDGEQSLELVDLGDYEEDVRLFLLGTHRLPREICMFVHVWPYVENFLGIWFPKRMKADAGRHYNFIMNGLGFVLVFGKDLPAIMPEIDSYHSVNKLIHVSKLFADSTISALRNSNRDLDTSALKKMNSEIERLRTVPSLI